MNKTKTTKSSTTKLMEKIQKERKLKLRRARKTQSALYGNMTCFI